MRPDPRRRQDKESAMTLILALAAAAALPQSPAQTVGRYRCGSENASLTVSGTKAYLTVGKAQYTMMRTKGGFASNTASFRDNGEDATLKVADRAPITCAKPLPPVTDPDFRANGTQPGWSLAVDSVAGRATLRTDNDRQVATVRLGSGGMVIDREPGGCEDPTSRRRLSDTVTVRYAGRTWRGCGEDVRREGRPMPGATTFSTAPGGAAMNDILGEWIVQDIDGRGVPGVGSMTLVIDGDRISGLSGCNRYFGTVRRTGNTLAIGPLGGTRMACPPELMMLESAFLTILERVTIISPGANGTVTLATPNGRRIVVRRA